MHAAVAAKVYADELTPRGYGYPLWYPEGRNGVIPRIGDVGYILDGAFVRLLNAKETKENKLEYDQDMLADTRPHALQTRVISSQSMENKSAGGAINA